MLARQSRAQAGARGDRGTRDARGGGDAAALTAEAGAPMRHSAAALTAVLRQPREGL